MTAAQAQAARLERVENNIAADDRAASAKAAISPLARLAAGDELNPEELTDEELASCFPAFAAVWMGVMDSLAAREGLRIGRSA